MALKNIMEIEGDLFIKTNYGQISKGKDVVAGVFYIKVDTINSNKEKGTAVVSFTNDKIEFTRSYFFAVSVVDGAPNFIKQAYEHLKTLPEFANAEDC
jgi:hypothetical protein